MKNIKTRDIIFYSIIGSLGILFIWVLFGTNLVFNQDGGSADVDTKPGEQVKNNFSMLNADVPKKEATESTDKSVLINEEMEAERKLEELRKNEEQDKLVQVKPLDDVSTYMERGGKALEQERAQNVASLKIEPVKVPENISNTSQPKQAPVKTQSVTPPAKKKVEIVESTPKVETTTTHRKRTRTGNPSFDDGTVQVVKEQSTGIQRALAVVHGDQSVVSGGRVIIRMAEDYEVTGCTTISSNTMLTGTVSAYGQRLNVVFSVTCDNGKKSEFEVYDASDNEKGIYVEVTTDEQAAGKEVARDVAQTGSSALGVPVVGRALSGLSSKKLSSKTVKLESGKKLFIEQVKKN